VGEPHPAALAAEPFADLGGRADERTDQLGLAALACQAVSGVWSPPARRVLARAMSPDPEQRFGSVTSFIEALEDAVLDTAAAAPAASAVAAAPAASAVAAAPAASAVAATTTATSAAPTSPAGAAGSLTQQFFAEGERQELAQAAEDHTEGVDAGEDDAGEDDAAVVSGALGRVPRSRAQMTAAALLVLGSVAVIGWTVVSLSRAHDPTGPSLAAFSPTPVAPPAVVFPAAPVPQAPAQARARAADHHPQGGTVSFRRGSSRLEPPPVSMAAVSARADVPAPATPSLAAAPPTPAALPPVAAPAAASVAPPAPAAVPPAETPPAAAAPAAPIDEDVTQPWEQTEGEPRQAAPAPAAPAEPAAPAAPAEPVAPSAP
jgi:hypothetical protein